MVASDNGLNSEITVIGCGTTIRGEVDFDHGARILGVFDGKIRSKGEVHITESAECNAEIDAENITIDGKTTGDVIARDRCRLSGNAKLAGDITAKTLLVEEGASFVGHCRVGENVDVASASADSATRSAPAAVATGAPAAAAAATRVDFKPPWKSGEGGGADAAARQALADANKASASKADGSRTGASAGAA